MQYLLDIDWVVHCLHGVARVTDRLDQLIPEGIGLSVVSMAELYQGVFFSTDPEGNERALHQFLAGIDVIPIDDAVCRIFASERGRLRAAGTPIGDFDLLIVKGGAKMYRSGGANPYHSIYNWSVRRWLAVRWS